MCMRSTRQACQLQSRRLAYPLSVTQESLAFEETIGTKLLIKLYTSANTCHKFCEWRSKDFAVNFGIAFAKKPRYKLCKKAFAINLVKRNLP